MFETRQGAAARPRRRSFSGGWARRGIAAVAAVALAAAVWPSRADEKAPEGSLAGRLLVATRSMPDSRFAETVIYMVRHDDAGAMGVVVNRPMGEVSLASLLDSLGIEGEAGGDAIRVHYGGPVERTRGLVLHSTDYVGEATLVVDDGFALTMDRDIVRDIVAGEGPERRLLAFGYAGWASGQLEAEMARDDWVTVPADAALVFEAADADKWARALARRTIDL